MKKRLLACLLILSLVLAGFVPTASAAEDGIVAQWTEKDALSTTGQEVALQPEKGLLSDAEDEPLAVESAKFSDSDVVTVIVELEDEPLLDVSAGDTTAFAASTRGQTMEQDIRRSQAEIKAQIQAISGVVSTQSVNGASGVYLHHGAQWVFHENALWGYPGGPADSRGKAHLCGRAVRPAHHLYRRGVHHFHEQLHRHGGRGQGQHLGL